MVFIFTRTILHSSLEPQKYTEHFGLVELYDYIFLFVDLELLHHKGLFNLSADEQKRKCIVYIRDIQNIDQHLDAKNAKCFVDLTKKSCSWDDEKKQKLMLFKSKVEAALDSKNVMLSSITLNGCALEESKSEEYIKGIARHFYSTVTSLIDEEIYKIENIWKDGLCKEVLSNWQSIKLFSTSFSGKEDILNSIKGYLLTETDQPLVIYGDTGSGKTTTIAKAACDINEAIANANLTMPTSIITRFIGQTDNSENIQQLLYHLCHQLAAIAGRYRQDVPSSYNSLKNYFIDLIQHGEYGGMLVILLDGLDKLSTTDNGHKLDWLPSRIAANVKIIANINTENVEMFQRIENKFEGGLIKMPILTCTDCENIMKLNMKSSGHSVNYNQWKCIQNAFKLKTSPLYVNLVFEQAIQWISSEIQNPTLGESSAAIAEQIFDNLETKFGTKLISKILGFITVSKTGLSESELEDILSLDDDVLNNVFSMLGCYAATRRFPQFCWTILRNALAPYLVFKEVNKIAVIQWKFKLFEKLAQERYARPDTETNNICHSIISDYYLGVWSGTKRKPFRHPAVLMAKYKRVDNEDEACRFVPEQPFRFEQSDSFNLRKISQLPYSLSCCNRCEDLKEYVLCNYEYISTKLRTSSIQCVLMDYLYTDKESNLVSDALRMSKSALEVNPNSLGMELSGRLLPHVHRYPYIKDLIRQCDLDCQRSCPLVPNCQIYSTPGGPLQYECDVAGNVLLC